MSSIPNSAMPHAGTREAEEAETPGFAERATKQARRAADLAAEIVRENPRKVIAAGAAGAAVAAGVATAAMLGAKRRKSSGNGAAAKSKSGGTSSSGSGSTKAPARKRAPARKAKKD